MWFEMIRKWIVFSTLAFVVLMVVFTLFMVETAPITSDRWLTQAMITARYFSTFPLTKGETHTYFVNCTVNSDSPVSLTYMGAETDYGDVVISIPNKEPYHYQLKTLQPVLVPACPGSDQLYDIGHTSSIHRDHAQMFYKELPEIDK